MKYLSLLLPNNNSLRLHTERYFTLLRNYVKTVELKIKGSSQDRSKRRVFTSSILVAVWGASYSRGVHDLSSTVIEVKDMESSCKCFLSFADASDAKLFVPKVLSLLGWIHIANDALLTK